MKQTSQERQVEERCKQVEKEVREERLRRRAAVLKKGSPLPVSGPARSVTVGPGERAVRSGDPASPAATTGHGPQRFPAPPRASVQEATVLVNATAMRRETVRAAPRRRGADARPRCERAPGPCPWFLRVRLGR